MSCRLFTKGRMDGLAHEKILVGYKHVRKSSQQSKHTEQVLFNFIQINLILSLFLANLICK